MIRIPCCCARSKVRFHSNITTQLGTVTKQTQSVNMTEANGTPEMMKPESVSLHPLGAAAAPAPEMLCIFGTGDLGRSLGLRLLQSGYRVVYGSRRPHSCGPLPQGAQVQHTAWCLLKLWNFFWCSFDVVVVIVDSWYVHTCVVRWFWHNSNNCVSKSANIVLRKRKRCYQTLKVDWAKQGHW